MPDKYFAHNELARDEYLGRTPLEQRQFTFALAEMSRMYAYHEVSVIVLPRLADPNHFNDGSGAPLLRNGDQVKLDGTDVVVLSGLAKGIVLNWCATNGQGEVITLNNLQGHVTEKIVRSAGNASCSFSNTCQWGRINPDPYPNRGWVRWQRCRNARVASDPAACHFQLSRACVCRLSRAYAVLLRIHHRQVQRDDRQRRPG